MIYNQIVTWTALAILAMFFLPQKLVFVLAKKYLFPIKNYFCRMDEIDVNHLDQQILTLIELSTSVDYTTGLLQDRIERN